MRSKDADFGHIRPSGGGFQALYGYKGKQHSAGVHPTQAKARAALAKVQEAIEAGTYVTPDQLRLGPFCEAFLADRQRQGANPNTLRAYRYALERVVLAAGGKRGVNRQLEGGPQIQRLGLRDVARIRDALPISPKTVRDYLGTLSAALQWGVKTELLARNVARLVDKPKAAAPQIEPLTVDEARRLMRVLEDWRDSVYRWPDGVTRPDHSKVPWACILAVGFLTILRAESELGGVVERELRILSETERAGILHRQHAEAAGAVAPLHHKLLAGGQYIPVAGNKGRPRLLAFPVAAVPFLRAQLAFNREYRLMFRHDWERNDVQGLLFRQHTGERLYPNTLRRKFKQVCTEAGIPAGRVHDLRHHGAILMLQGGHSVKGVQEMGGWSTYKQVMDRYAAHVPGLAAQAGNWLGRLLDGTEEMRQEAE